MTIHGITTNNEQHTPGWFRDRLGRITGSSVGKLMATPRKGEFTDTAMSYIYQIAAERSLSPDVVNDDDMLMYFIDMTSSTSKAMRFGTEQESDARAAYAERRGVEVCECGLIIHPALSFFGSSPDGLLTESTSHLGCLEIKCPSPSTFARYSATIADNASLLAANAEYYWQVMAHMAVTGADFADFAVYCPFAAQPLNITTIKRDDEAIARMEERVTMADAKANAIIQEINKKIKAL